MSVTLFYGGHAALLCKCATGSDVPGKVASKKGEGTLERVLALAQALLPFHIADCIWYTKRELEDHWGDYLALANQNLVYRASG